MSTSTTPTDAIMEQAQVFASAWSLVGGPFDSGDGHAEALAAKEELRRMVADALAQPAAADPAQPRLKVRLTSFPESNGKRNWTALLVREQPWGGLVGNCGGISLARGELWNRVAYEAQCAMYLIGARDTEPFILDFGDDIETPDQWKGEVDLADRRARKSHHPR